MKEKISVWIAIVLIFARPAFSELPDEVSSKEQLVTQAVGSGALTETYELTGENLLALIEKMVDFSKPGTAIVFNRWTGQIFVRQTLQGQEEISRILSEIRRSRDQQVEIEARILTVRGGDFSQIGLDFAGLDFMTTHKKRRLLGTDAGFADSNFDTRIDFQNLTDESGNPAGGQLSLTTLSRRFNLAALIDFLERNVAMNTLAAPRLTVLNNQRAHIKITEANSFVKSLTMTSDVNAATVATEMDVDVAESGTVLDVTPTVNRDGTITLELHPQFVTADLSRTQTINVAGGSIVSSQSQPFVRLPVFTNQSIDTTVTVEDGGVIVLGGLIDERETKNTEKVPGLSRIPLFGRLFKNDKVSRTKTHLLIFLKARLAGERKGGT